MAGEIVEIFRAGGVIMYALLATSLSIWALMAWWWLSLRWSSNSVKSIAYEASETFQREGREACLAVLKTRRGFFGKGLCKLIAMPSHKICEADIDVLLSGVKLRLSGPGYYLRVLVKVAPLLGLLGTVYGMIKAFDALSLMGVAEPAALAEGISCALITTQAGLVIALPGLYGHEWLRRVSTRVHSEIQGARYALSSLVR